MRRVAMNCSLPSSSGFAKDIMSSGKISGTPPTRVETTYKPAHAASRIAMPNDSVKEVFKNIEPRTRIYQGEKSLQAEVRYDEWPRTSRTSLCRTGPNSSIRSWRKFFSLICSNSFSLGPVPPWNELPWVPRKNNENKTVTNQELDLGKCGTDTRGCGYQEIYSFAIC